jgi:cation diffusion facilitator family transporter
MAAGGSVKVILGSLAANAGIAVSKGVAAVFTGSGAMLAEAIHSAADCSNQLLLLLGAREGAKGPSPEYPLGRGRAVYFWSFIVSLMLFAGGGVFAIYEGIHKLTHHEALDDAWVGYIVLVIAIGIEVAACVQVVRALNKGRGDTPFFKYLKDSKDSDLVVLAAEDSAAIVGLVVALVALALTDVTGNPMWDAYGTITIGVLLCLVAIWLATEMKSLLQGEAAAPRVEATFRDECKKEARIQSVLNILTMQQGPGQVVVAAKIRLKDDLGAKDVCEAINELEKRVKAREADVRWMFIEPDVVE